MYCTKYSRGPTWIRFWCHMKCSPDREEQVPQGIPPGRSSFLFLKAPQRLMHDGSQAGQCHCTAGPDHPAQYGSSLHDEHHDHTCATELSGHQVLRCCKLRFPAMPGQLHWSGSTWSSCYSSKVKGNNHACSTTEHAASTMNCFAKSCHDMGGQSLARSRAAGIMDIS